MPISLLSRKRERGSMPVSTLSRKRERGSMAPFPFRARGSNASFAFRAQGREAKPIFPLSRLRERAGVRASPSQPASTGS